MRACGFLRLRRIEHELGKEIDMDAADLRAL